MNRDFPTFSGICIFVLLTLSLRLFSLLIFLLSASALLCFSSVHIVGSLISKLPSIIFHFYQSNIYRWLQGLNCKAPFLSHGEMHAARHVLSGQLCAQRVVSSCSKLYRHELPSITKPTLGCKGRIFDREKKKYIYIYIYIICIYKYIMTPCHGLRWDFTFDEASNMQKYGIDR